MRHDCNATATVRLRAIFVRLPLDRRSQIGRSRNAVVNAADISKFIATLILSHSVRTPLASAL